MGGVYPYMGSPQRREKSRRLSYEIRHVSSKKSRRLSYEIRHVSSKESRRLSYQIRHASSKKCRRLSYQIRHVSSKKGVVLKDERISTIVKLNTGS
jgi:hypothetical protein